MTIKYAQRRPRKKPFSWATTGVAGLVVTGVLGGGAIAVLLNPSEKDKQPDNTIAVTKLQKWFETAGSPACHLAREMTDSPVKGATAIQSLAPPSEKHFENGFHCLAYQSLWNNQTKRRETSPVFYTAGRNPEKDTTIIIWDGNKFTTHRGQNTPHQAITKDISNTQGYISKQKADELIISAREAVCHMATKTHGSPVKNVKDIEYVPDNNLLSHTFSCSATGTDAKPVNYTVTGDPRKGYIITLTNTP